MSSLVRFGISLDGELLDRFDRIIKAKGYATRSEAIRDLMREKLVEERWEQGTGEVAGTITIVYSHHTNGLGDLLTDLQHAYHHLIVSTMHVHLDHDHCLEVLVVKGRPDEARAVADRLTSVKGVLHGRLTLTSTGTELL